MKKFFLNLKDNHDKLKEFYTEKEFNQASIASFIFTLIISILIALLDISFFLVFVYMPYLAYTVSGLCLIWIIVIYYLFLISILKKTKEPEDFSLYKAFLIEFLIYVIGVIIITFLLELITIPLFFL